jgi:NTP pyrophosphatase (non-canonical NTP hydrolase)
LADLRNNETSAQIAALATSVQRFHERFGQGSPASHDEMLDRIPIQDEEVRELEQALRGEGPVRTASEAVDVLFVAIGTILRLDPELASAAIDEVIVKNDAKTRVTHHINAAGKVVRKP